MFLIHKKTVQIFSVCLESFQTANIASLQTGCPIINVFALEETFLRVFKLGLIIKIKSVLFVLSVTDCVTLDM